jgi:hypothetical protein
VIVNYFEPCVCVCVCVSVCQSVFNSQVVVDNKPVSFAVGAVVPALGGGDE